jgi:16S rRNA (adenine1518-N6/adenine1519-N6)-dimethyltransferase
VSEFPRTTRALREALAAHGLAPLKRHGQCFLTDVQAVDAIVRDAEVQPGDAVVEVGTGTGLLTHALCEAGATIDTFDVDAGVQELARSLRAWPDRVRFHAADALEGKHALSGALLDALTRSREAAGPGRVRFVSNLPYNAATPVLLALLALDDPPDSITAMVQLEVAEKLLAATGEEGYGPPSILRALEADGRILRRFPPQVFWPTPSVRSALLRLVPRRPRALGRGEERPFGDFLLRLFSRRRKVLSTALRAARPALAPEAAVAALRAVGIDPGARPEDASPPALLELFRSTGIPVTGTSPAASDA